MPLSPLSPPPPAPLPDGITAQDRPRAPASRPLHRYDASQSNGERVKILPRWPPVDASSNRNGVLVALCRVLYCRVVPTAYNLQQCTRAHALAYITLVINCIHILKYSAHALKYFESRPPASHPSPCCPCYNIHKSVPEAILSSPVPLSSKLHLIYRSRAQGRNRALVSGRCRG